MVVRVDVTISQRKNPSAGNSGEGNEEDFNNTKEKPTMGRKQGVQLKNKNSKQMTSHEWAKIKHTGY